MYISEMFMLECVQKLDNTVSKISYQSRTMNTSDKDISACEMDEFLGKKYVLINSENFDDYLTFVGVSFIARKIALALKQTVRLTRNKDGSYKFHFISPLANSDFVFTPGEEFEETRPDGVKMKSIITIEDNVMTHTHTDNTGRTSKHVLEFYADKMITTTTGEGFDKIVKRYYEAR